MSWPDDNLPRFAVGTVTGHRINPQTLTYSSGKRPMPTAAYVYDRAYCHRIVAAFDRVGGNRFRTTRGAVAQAVAYAAALNEREQAVNDREQAAA